MSAVSHAAERAYLAAHRGDEAGAVTAGWIASLRVARATDPHAIPTQGTEVRAAIREADISAIEAWVDANWTEIEEAA